MIELIPAIDIIDGHCVRLTQGDYNQQTTYDADPVDIAKAFEDAGVKRLHTVDLDGARSNHVVNARTIERIAAATNLVIDFGGGIKSTEDLQTAFNAGAAMVTVGSLAVKNPQLFLSWTEEFGPDRFILGADAKNGRISISGWKEEDGQELLPFVKSYFDKGLRQVLCTDISRDGMLQGPAVELYRDLMTHFPALHLIASGGVSSMDDILSLDEAGIPAVVFGKAFYEGRISLKDLEQFIMHNA